MKASKVNKGFLTEQRHFEILSQKYPCVSVPKNSSTGSDFIVQVPVNDSFDVHQRVAFESKTSNTDIFEFGTLSVFSNGSIFNASTHITNYQLGCIQTEIKDRRADLEEYCLLAKASEFPHAISITDYQHIKSQQKLIHWQFNVHSGAEYITTSLKKTAHDLVKANYLLIDNSVYCINGVRDVLNLKDRGAGIICDQAIDYMSIRSARGGTRNGRASVALRVQFKLKRILPKSDLKITEL